MKRPDRRPMHPSNREALELIGYGIALLLLIYMLQ